MIQTYFPDNAPVVIGVDGATVAQTDYTVYAGEGCASVLCASEEQMICAVVDLLPCGALLWDKEKAYVKQTVSDSGGIPTEGFETTSMAVYAAFLGQSLHSYVSEILVSSYRESNPITAVTTREEWLTKLGWVDCFRSVCRDECTARFSPYENTLDQCSASSYFPTDFSAEFESALAHNTLRAIRRMQRGVIKNLSGINFVLSPLGIELAPQTFHPKVQDYLDGNLPYEDCVPCFSCYASFELRSVSPTLAAAPVDDACGGTPAEVDALQDYIDADGNATALYPGMMVAECIVRSLIGQQCSNIIYRTA